MLEKQNEYFANKNFGSTSKRPITSKSSAMSMKDRIDSDVSKGSAAKAEQRNIRSKSITSQRTSLATKNMRSTRK